MGYDGIYFHGPDPIKDAFSGEVYRERYDQWGAFHPEQIKSARNNVGTFNPRDARVNYMPGDRVTTNANGSPVRETSDYTSESSPGEILRFKDDRSQPITIGRTPQYSPSDHAHFMPGDVVSELIRQLVQIRFGELTSEEAKGKTWDKKRLFNTAKFGTTENLLRFMAGTLRQGVSKLISLSPTLTEALLEIEGTIQKIHQISCVSWQDQDTP
jgi:hypothetical protein